MGRFFCLHNLKLCVKVHIRTDSWLSTAYKTLILKTFKNFNLYLTSLSPHRQGYCINETWNVAKQSLYQKMSVCSGKVYAVGGHDGNEHLGSMEVFDPLTNKWMMKASMNTKRYMCPTLPVLVCDVPFLADAEKHPACPAFLGGFQTVLFPGISFLYFGTLCYECTTLLSFFWRSWLLDQGPLLLQLSLHSSIQGLSAVPTKQLGTDELVLWGFCSF